MKKKFLTFVLLITAVAATLCLLPACDGNTEGSLKSITHPYVAEYECIEARYGEDDLLEKYEFIKITLVDKQKLEVSYKPKDGEKQVYEGSYEIDDKTREMTGDIGIFGFKFREKIKIENGGFTVTRNILAKPLILKFKTK